MMGCPKDSLLSLGTRAQIVSLRQESEPEMTHAAMRDGTRIGLMSTCPKCGHEQAQWYSDIALHALMQRGQGLQGYCVTCDKHWELTALEHQDLAAELSG
jgi:hypothetical protein